MSLEDHRVRGPTPMAETKSSSTGHSRRTGRPFRIVGSVKAILRSDGYEHDRAAPLEPVRATDPSSTEGLQRQPSRCTSHCVEVQVLGPTQILGASRPFRRAWTFDLIVYLAMHPQGASNDVWSTALWPDFAVASTTLHSTVSSARRSIGRAPDGQELLRREQGVLRLGPEVITDWYRFRELAGAPDPPSWRRALSLVRGRPFEGLRRPDWTVLEGISATVEETVAQLAIQVAEHELNLGDGARASAAARRGLLASPYDERLYRILLKSADQQGNPAGVESAMAELVCLLGGGARPGQAVRSGLRPEKYVHPATTELYRALSRRSPPVPEGSDSKL
ncbi:MAG: AfsR/SARP family transcriptional regulator [Acidimicrobiales bacterium]